MKTIPGRISFSRSGFTLIELLVVIGIIAVLAGIALPVMNNVQRKTRATVEANSARQIVAGYLAYAADNDGELLPGYLAGASVEFPNGDVGAGPEAERYPWRLAPYLQWNADIYMVNDLQKTVASMDRGSTEYRYMVSLAPALGLNTYCVGGYQTATSTMAKKRCRPAPRQHRPATRGLRLRTHQNLRHERRAEWRYRGQLLRASAHLWRGQMEDRRLRRKEGVARLWQRGFPP